MDMAYNKFRSAIFFRWYGVTTQTICISKILDKNNS